MKYHNDSNDELTVGIFNSPIMVVIVNNLLLIGAAIILNLLGGLTQSTGNVGGLFFDFSIGFYLLMIGLLLSYAYMAHLRLPNLPTRFGLIGYYLGSFTIPLLASLLFIEYGLFVLVYATLPVLAIALGAALIELQRRKQ